MANPSEFFAQMMPYAQQVSQRTGLDPRLVLAQAALETGYGRSAPNNNFFGIKSHGRSGGSTLQTQEFEGGRMVSVPQSFRGYESPEQSFMDYANFITSNPRYRPVLEAKDLEGQIRAMGASGYATDPDYAAKLANIAGMVDPSARVSTPTQGGRQMAIMEQQPQGLLGALGIQRRDPTAQGETALPFYQRETFGNTLDNVMLALNSMTLRPDPNLAQQIGQRRQERTSAKQRNATLEYLRNLKTPRAQEALQYGEATGDISGALKMAMDRPDAPKGVVMGDRLVDPRTGQVIADFTGQGPQYKPEDIAAARKEFTSLAPVKDFAEQTSAYGRILSSVEDPSPAGDLSLIFNYMKVLDPGSTVREGEFATAEQAGSVDARVRGLYNRILSGERLTPEQRADFANRATRLYQGAEVGYRSLADQYGGFARAAGLPVEQVIPDFGYTGQLYETPLQFRVPPPPAGIQPDQWKMAWQNMTDEERRQFIQDQR